MRGYGGSPEHRLELVSLQNRLHRGQHEWPRRDDVGRAALEHLDRHLLGDYPPNLLGPQRLDRALGERLRLTQLQPHVAGYKAGKRQDDAQHDQSEAAPASHTGIVPAIVSTSAVWPPRPLPRAAPRTI
jgi:hypothetical protein